MIDGIVFDTPSNSKVVVAVMDPARGPVFRTVHPRILDEREQEGPGDAVDVSVPAMRGQRRTAPPASRHTQGDTGAEFALNALRWAGLASCLRPRPELKMFR